MRNFLVRVTVALLTFVIGTLCSFLASSFVTHRSSTQELTFTITNPVVPTCFPGVSLPLKEISNEDGSYFPVNTFGQREDSKYSRASWYSKHLKAMGETSYLNAKGSLFEDYRFLWLRSFHHPISVRIWRVDDQSFITLKELNGAGGYEPGSLIVNRTRQLNLNDYQTFNQLLEKACFWNLPTTETAMGNDGAEWILEGVRHGRYHVVDRWSPETGDYREACLYLLKISGIGIDETSQELY